MHCSALSNIEKKWQVSLHLAHYYCEHLGARNDQYENFFHLYVTYYGIYPPVLVISVLID